VAGGHSEQSSSNAGFREGGSVEILNDATDAEAQPTAQQQSREDPQQRGADRDDDSRP
jgi:hypothetical protein